MGAFPDSRAVVDSVCANEKNNNQEMLEVLLRARGDPNSKYNGKTAMTCAAQQCSLPLTWKLLHAGAYIDSSNQEGYTPLLVALYTGCEELSSFFINHRANIKASTPSGDNALQLACVHCMSNVARLLLDHNISVNHKDTQGFTALHTATKYDCADIVSALLNNVFTDANDVDDKGKTPLFYAAALDLAGIMNLLIEKGADVNQRAQGELTPLMEAVVVGKLQADVGLVDSSGNTALWMAATHGEKEVANLLLNSGSAPYLD
ncbi:unnamed protein product, partial [Polarella glacialis]